MISRPIAFNIDEVICDTPRGIMTIVAKVRYIPALVLLNRNLQIGIPIAIKTGMSMLENIIDDLIENITLFLREVKSSTPSLSMSFDCSLIVGTIVTARELISVDGIMMIGNVMPIMIPNSDNASVDE